MDDHTYGSFIDRPLVCSMEECLTKNDCPVYFQNLVLTGLLLQMSSSIFGVVATTSVRSSSLQTVNIGLAMSTSKSGCIFVLLGNFPFL